MRILPDAPSVDYLRREAKDVLLALREDRPDASLAEAQALLAEQYGHRTWAGLKAEADRRRLEPGELDELIATLEPLAALLLAAQDW